MAESKPCAKCGHVKSSHAQRTKKGMPCYSCSCGSYQESITERSAACLGCGRAIRAGFDFCGNCGADERDNERTFTKERHHELCLGVMASCYPLVNKEIQQAIREGIESAALLGFPVDCRNLEKGGPLFTRGNA